MKHSIVDAVIAQGATLDLVGASSFMWRQQHVAGHHVWTNVHDKDPDIRVSDADVRRVTPFQPAHPYQVRCAAACRGPMPVCSVAAVLRQQLGRGADGRAPACRRGSTCTWGRCTGCWR